MQTRSIKTYTLSFITIIVVVFILLGWYSYTRYEVASADIERLNRVISKDEITDAFRAAENQALVIARSIASWDEAKQQLANPAFYDYWRDNRVPSGGVQHAALEAVELYTRYGAALSNTPGRELPKQLHVFEESAWLQLTDDGVRIQAVAPFKAAADDPDPQGFVGVQLDFIAALKSAYNTRFADLNTLRFNIGKDERITVGQAPGRVEYELLQNPVIDAWGRSTIGMLLLFGSILAGFSFAVYLFMAYLLERPLTGLSRYIDALRSGKREQIDPVLGGALPIKELSKVVMSLEEYRQKLSAAYEDLDQKNRELWTLAHYDSLTGAFNRRAYDSDWLNILSVTEHRRIDISLLIFDIDRFKVLNDTYGHDVGDRILIAVVNDIQDALRQGDKLYRLGGDEFVAVLLDSEPKFVEGIAVRCKQRIESRNYKRMGIGEPVRISIGLAHTSATDVERLYELQREADTALYYAKRPGHSKIAVYEESMLTDSLSLFSNRLAESVNKVIEDGTGLKLYYQPVINVGDGKVVYYEALTRIEDEKHLLEPPSIFPIVENRRLEVEFDLAVINSAMADLENGIIPNGVGIAINLSGTSILDKLVERKLRELIDYNSKHPLTLEITESALITRLHTISEHLKHLRDAGFSISLDDFGSGFSSLRNLAEMPVDSVKFDISLVQCLTGEQRESGIIRSLAVLIAESGFDLIAEGIETKEQLDAIRALKFTRAQGFYIGRPAREIPRAH